MKTATPHPTVTNVEVAEKIGLDHSMVSRIRGGKRIPSFDSMTLIEAAYGWPLSEQAHSRKRKTYAQDFEAIINDH